MSIKELYRHKYYYPNSKYDLDDPKERAKLEARNTPYWMALGPGRHLGYRKGLTCNTWQVRVRLRNGEHRWISLGQADDGPLIAGRPVLSYEQARQKAFDWISLYSDDGIGPFVPHVGHMEIPRPADQGVYTVAHAIADDLEWRQRNGADVRADLGGAKAHIFPELGGVPLADLTVSQLVSWFEELPFKPKRLPSPKYGPPRYGLPPNNEEELRRRKRSANRWLLVLKRALERAHKYGLTDKPEVWRSVPQFRKIHDYMPRYLNLSECRQLLSATEPRIGDLVRGVLLTGCRIGELTRLKVEDYLPQSGKLYLKKTKSGYSRIIALTEAGARFFDQIAKDRRANEFMFLMDADRPWFGQVPQKALYNTCKTAGIKPPVSFHGLRHTYSCYATMAGLPMIVLARQLGHATSRSVERYYGHLTEDFIDEKIRELVPDLVGDL